MIKFNDSYSDTKIADLRQQEEERFIQSKAPQLGFEYINLRGITINPEAIAIIPEKKAKEAEVVGFDLNRQTLSVAVKNPTHPKTQELLQNLQNQSYTVAVYMCSLTSLEHSWIRYKDIIDSSTSKHGVLEISPEDISKLTNGIRKKEDVAVILKKIKTVNSSRRISETLELIFAGGLALKASDIHIEPEESVIRVRYRFDGVLHDIIDIDPYIYQRMISRLKLLSGMILNSHQEAQDGRFTFDTSDRKVEVRSSIIPGAGSESIVMRLLDPTVASFSMDKIKLNPHILAVMKNELKKPNGLIITTGPTGSGKTTALYAFLKETHNEGVKIITIENPVEYKLEGIVQTQTGDDYTFSSGLRAVLRQDPDIIMVGEIRDHEVAETAIHAAQTGHLVFSTLHTNSAIAGFPRLMDLGVDPRIMGSSINIIIGQRLVRLLCSDCKKRYPTTTKEQQLLDYVMRDHPHPILVPQPLNLYKPTGCTKCNGTGFKGRTGIFEGVLMDEAVEEALIRDPREHIIAEAAKPQGIPTMIQDGVEKIIQGLVSINELARVVELPNQAQIEKDVVSPTITPLDTETNVDEKADDEFLAHVV